MKKFFEGFEKQAQTLRMNPAGALSLRRAFGGGRAAPPPPPPPPPPPMPSTDSSGGLGGMISRGLDRIRG